MITKILELRDSATFIPIMAIQLNTEDAKERYLCARAGFGQTNISFNQYIYIFPLNCSKSVNFDIYEWSDRTYFTAHKYVIENWDKLKIGDVIDVEFILGETKVKKISEYEEMLNDKGR